MGRRKTAAEAATILLRFTGAAGADSYAFDDGACVLARGDTIRISLSDPHWQVLLESGNAEVVEE